VNELSELKRGGLTIQAISELTGYDPRPSGNIYCSPKYAPRTAPPSKLEEFKPYLAERLKAGVWNAQVLLRELKQVGYQGGYTILKGWLQPQRSETRAVAVRRYGAKK